jgi:hypothetical protein
MKSPFQISVKQLTSAKMKKALDNSKACGDEWARTTDSRIFSPMLYQLSYITPVK